MTDVKNLTNEEQKLIAARRAYQKEWRAKNKDRIKQYNHNFFKKLAEKQEAAEENVEI